MGNCLVTKLKGAVNNDNLLKLGETAIDFLSEMSYEQGVTENRVVIHYADGAAHQIKTSGNLYMLIGGVWVQQTSHAGGTINLKGSGRLHIEDKYNINTFETYDKGAMLNNNILEANYLQSMIDVQLYSLNWTPESYKQHLMTLGAGCLRVASDCNPQTGGSLEITLDEEAALYVKNSAIQSMYTFGINFPNGTELSDFENMANLTLGTRSVYQWKGTRQGTIMSLYGGINLGDDVDAMLINQAALEEPHPTTSHFKLIHARGNRTSASDAAIATLQAKGYGVNIQPA